MPAEPQPDGDVLTDDQQVNVAKVLLGQATAWIHAAVKSPASSPEKERRELAGAAHRASATLSVAQGIIENHTQRNKVRMSLSASVDELSHAVEDLDQWVRVSAIDAEPGIAKLYAAERDLRMLVGLKTAERAPVGSVDSDSKARELVKSGSKPPAPSGTVGEVRSRLAFIVGTIGDKIVDFDAGARAVPGKKPDSLVDKLIASAVEAVLVTNIEAFALKLAITKLAQVDNDSEDDAAEVAIGEGAATDLLHVVVQHAFGALKGASEPAGGPTMLDSFSSLLRARHRELERIMSDRFEAQVPTLARVHAAGLRQLVTRLDQLALELPNDFLANYVLEWQNLKARAALGIPDTSSEIAANAKNPDQHPLSVRDANVLPGLVAEGSPGMLHVHIAVEDSGKWRRGSRGVHIEGVTDQHLKAIKQVKRTLDELSLNTIITVTYNDAMAGYAEIVRTPDTGAIRLAWGGNGDDDMTNARHLQAVALGVPVRSPVLDSAGNAEALAGAHVIAEQALTILGTWSLS
jgi:hypothetical protein